MVVALANLASTMLLAARERTHDLGVLRAVGVTSRQVVAMLASSSAALGLLAAAVGVPLGWAVSNAVTEVSGLGPGIGAGPGRTGVIMPLTLTVAALLGALASRRAAVAEVSDLVRHE